MAGKGTSDLPIPPRRFDPRERWTGFELYSAKVSEDSTRARHLRRTAKRFPLLADEMRALADAIDPEVTDLATSPASSRAMRRYRRRLVGALWSLYHEA